MIADKPTPGPEVETPEQWADRVLAEHGPMPENVATRIREAFDETRRRLREQQERAS